MPLTFKVFKHHWVWCELYYGWQ